MLTREVREWLQKVERGQYSHSDAIDEFLHFLPYLTKGEAMMLKSKLEQCYKP